MWQWLEHLYYHWRPGGSFIKQAGELMQVNTYSLKALSLVCNFTQLQSNLNEAPVLFVGYLNLIDTCSSYDLQNAYT